MNSFLFRITNSAFLIGSLIVLQACSFNGEDEIPDFNEQLAKDIAAIDAYLAANNIDAIEHPSGIRYVMFTDVTTKKPTTDSCVTTNYKGVLLASGQTFDDGEAIAFRLNEVIEGWQVGIALLDEGDSARLFVPSGLAYGFYGFPPAIPSNANMIFDVGLDKVGSSYRASDRSCN